MRISWSVKWQNLGKNLFDYEEFVKFVLFIYKEEKFSKNLA